ASNAMTAAQQAQATADGSIVTYYQITAPWTVITPSVDPSFESGTNGCIVAGNAGGGTTISSDATRAPTGSKSLKISSAATAGLGSITKNYAVTAGKTYT